MTGVEDLLSTLHHIRSRLNSADNTSSSNGSQEVFFLKQLFHNPQFQQAVAMHQKMVDVTSRSPQPRPLGTDSQELVADLVSSSPVRGSEPAFKELVTLLHKPLVKVWAKDLEQEAVFVWLGGWLVGWLVGWLGGWVLKRGGRLCECWRMMEDRGFRD